MTKEPNKYLPAKVRRVREDLARPVKQLELAGLTVAGSWRREKDTVGDLDALVPPELGMERAVHSAQVFFGYEEIRGGAMKSEGIATYRDQPLNLNFWYVPDPHAWAAMLLFATGPHDLNIMMRSRAKGRGLLLSQYGLFTPGKEGEDNTQLDDGVEEIQIFELLGLVYLTPVEREHWRDYLIKTPSQSVEVQVPSSDGVNFYTVTLKDGKGFDCNCKGFGYRNQCRHLQEAEELYKG
jgi:DNA polymerase/3'-5' exonuclease PolX